MKNIFKVLKSNNAYSAAILLLRIAVGVALMFHGQNKIKDPFGWMGASSEMPGILQALAAISEFVGGMFLVVGLLTPLSGFGILCTMGFAVYRHAIIKGDPFVGKPSYELALIYFLITVVLLVAGPGKFSLDRAIFGQK